MNPFQSTIQFIKNHKPLTLLATILILALTAVLIWRFGFYLPQQQARKELEEQMQTYYYEKVAQFRQENAQYAPGQVDIVFLGDSLTDGYPVAEHYSEYVVVNRGIGGDTTFGLENRLQVSVYDLQPKVAVMLIGANNMDTMFENYERILQGFVENLPDTKIVLVSLTAMGQEWGRKNNLAAFQNVKIKKLAQQYGFAYVDLFTPLLNLETNEIYAEYTTDGGHQTPAGYRVFTNTIAPVLKKLLHGK